MWSFRRRARAFNPATRSRSAVSGESKRLNRETPPSLSSEALRQGQFLTVLPREEARRLFVDALRPKPLGSEVLSLREAIGRVLADDLASPGDVPPFDRSGVDGFAVRS